MAKLKTIINRIISKIDGFSAYVFMVLGIIFFNNSEIIKNATNLSQININIGQIIFSAGIAFIIIFKSEKIPSSNEEKEIAKAGRQKRFWHRMMAAFTHGYTWQGALAAMVEFYNTMGAK